MHKLRPIYLLGYGQMGWIRGFPPCSWTPMNMGATHVGPLGYGDFSRRQFRQMTTKT